MPGDFIGQNECEGPGATHHYGCACREAYVKHLEETLLEVKDGLFIRMSETARSLDGKFKRLRDRISHTLEGTK